MRGIRYLLPTLAAALAVSAGGFAQDTEKDQQAVMQFIKGKRSISMRDKGGDLFLSGDVRFEYQSITETNDGAKVRGSNTGIANHEFDVEVNLMLDYMADDTWASVKLEFDNTAGNTPGFTDPANNAVPRSWNDSAIALERAYAGYNILSEDTARLDVELGRWQSYDLFNSKVQFNSNFDGLVFKYSNNLEAAGDLYATGGVAISDDRIDHYMWAAEFGLGNVVDTGVWAKYSYIDWDTSNPFAQVVAAVDTNNSAKFRNSQLTVGYDFAEEMLDMPVGIYAAYLMNHAAVKRTITNNKKENKAWYMGVVFGGAVEFAGDWSVDLSYQSVEAQAVKESDMAGIGRGNRSNSVFDTAGTAGTARGEGNWEGWSVEALYAVTDNLTMAMEYETSDEGNKNIGGRHGYHKFEVEMIYGF
ncbi:Uncharacterized protein SCG7109_AE_00370 [Chlamydiales bacterium SCGC AG-110-M15]|nr:Uncharacterized protein SCG7109_AE_00370 [Chlamydiales bacterium SCGC AG-110-M15]